MKTRLFRSLPIAALLASLVPQATAQTNLHTVASPVRDPQALTIDSTFAPFGNRPDTDKSGDDGSVAIRDRNGVIIWVDKFGNVSRIPDSGLAKTIFVSNTECVVHQNRFDGRFNTRGSTSQIVIHRRAADGNIQSIALPPLNGTLLETSPITPNTYGFTIAVAATSENGAESRQTYQTGFAGNPAQPTYGIQAVDQWDQLSMVFYRITWEGQLQNLFQFSENVPQTISNLSTIDVLGTGSDGSFVFGLTTGFDNSDSMNPADNDPDMNYFKRGRSLVWVTWNQGYERATSVDGSIIWRDADDGPNRAPVYEFGYTTNSRLLISKEQWEVDLTGNWVSSNAFDVLDYRQRANGQTGIPATTLASLAPGERIMPYNEYTRRGMPAFIYTISPPVLPADPYGSINLYNATVGWTQLGAGVPLPSPVLTDASYVRNALDGSVLVKSETSGILWIPTTVDPVTKATTGIAGVRSLPGSAEGLPMLVSSEEAIAWMNSEDPVNIADGGTIPPAVVTHFGPDDSVAADPDTDPDPTPLAIEGRYVALPPPLSPNPYTEGWYVSTFEKDKTDARKSLIRAYKIELADTADLDKDGLTDFEEIAMRTNPADPSTGPDPGNPDSDGDGLNDGEEVLAMAIVSGSFTWEEARRNAQSRAARLAVLDSTAKQANFKKFLGKTINSGSIQYWLGASDWITEGQYQWVDSAGNANGPLLATPLNAAPNNFALPFQPNNIGDADGLEVQPNSDLLWAMGGRTKRQGYIIEFKVSSAIDPDSDNDGLLDGIERSFGTDPTNPDTDGDGLNDKVEYDLGTNPRVTDTDGDGRTDSEEQTAFGSGGWTSNPLVADTDGDLYSDFDEINAVPPTNPRDRSSKPQGTITTQDGTMHDLVQIERSPVDVTIAQAWSPFGNRIDTNRFSADGSSILADVNGNLLWQGSRGDVNLIPDSELAVPLIVSDSEAIIWTNAYATSRDYANRAQVAVSIYRKNPTGGLATARVSGLQGKEVIPTAKVTSTTEPYTIVTAEHGLNLGGSSTVDDSQFWVYRLTSSGAPQLLTSFPVMDTGDGFEASGATAAYHGSDGSVVVQQDGHYFATGGEVRTRRIFWIDSSRLGKENIWVEIFPGTAQANYTEATKFSRVISTSNTSLVVEKYVNSSPSLFVINRNRFTGNLEGSPSAFPLGEPASLILQSSPQTIQGNPVWFYGISQLGDMLLAYQLVDGRGRVMYKATIPDGVLIGPGALVEKINPADGSAVVVSSGANSLLWLHPTSDTSPDLNISQVPGSQNGRTMFVQKNELVLFANAYSAIPVNGVLPPAKVYHYQLDPGGNGIINPTGGWTDLSPRITGQYIFDTPPFTPAFEGWLFASSEKTGPTTARIRSYRLRNFNDADDDGDRLTNGMELNPAVSRPFPVKTDPSDPDSDNDGLPDGREVQPFVIVTGSFTFEEARLDAIARGGRLAVPSTAEKQASLERQVQGEGLNARFWIGGGDLEGPNDASGSREGQYVWVDPAGQFFTTTGQNVGVPLTYLKWAIGQPANSGDADGMQLEQDFSWSMGQVVQRQGYILEYPATNPNLNDTDGDGLTDMQEMEFFSNPILVDTDGDGLNDKQESDFGTNPRNRDTDGDGLTDKQEFDSGSDPGNVDGDNDGLTDGRERALGTDPRDPDSDDDGLPDGREVQPFVVVTGSYTLEEARLDAIARGGRLAVPSNAGRQAGLERQIGLNPPQGNFWLGGGDTDGPNDAAGTREGQYVWVNWQGRFFGANGQSVGVPLTYFNWATGQPGNANDSDGIQILPDFKWSMALTSVRQGYILEYPVTSPTTRDSDGDGLTDNQEVEFRSNPTMVDTDGDGLNDKQESDFGTDPRNRDADGDGLTDKQEFDSGTNPAVADSDGDGLNDKVESDFGSNPLVADTDGDGLTDSRERTVGSSPVRVDTDGDTLRDGDEVNTHGTSPLLVDSDGDTISDARELLVHKTNPIIADSDGDGLTDFQEIFGYMGFKPNPLVVDSDGDLFNDFDELSAVPATDPNDPSKYPGPGSGISLPSADVYAVPTLVNQQAVAIDDSFSPYGHRPDRHMAGDDGSGVMIDRNGVLIWTNKAGAAISIPNATFAKALHVSNTECVVYNNRYRGHNNVNEVAQIIIYRRGATGGITGSATVSITGTVLDTNPLTPTTHGFTLLSGRRIFDGNESTRITQGVGGAEEAAGVDQWDNLDLTINQLTWNGQNKPLDVRRIVVPKNQGANFTDLNLLGFGSDGSVALRMTTGLTSLDRYDDSDPGVFASAQRTYWVSVNPDQEDVSNMGDDYREVAYVSNNRLILQFQISATEFELLDFRRGTTGPDLASTLRLPSGERIIPVAQQSLDWLPPYIYTLNTGSSTSGTSLRLYRADASLNPVGAPVTLPTAIQLNGQFVRNPRDASLLIKSTSSGLVWVPTTRSGTGAVVTGLGTPRLLPSSSQGVPLFVTAREAVVWMNSNAAPLNGALPPVSIAHFRVNSARQLLSLSLTPPIEGRFLIAPLALTPDPDLEGWYLTTSEKESASSAVFRTYQLGRAGSANDRDEDGIYDLDELTGRWSKATPKAATDASDPDSDDDGVVDGRELMPFEVVTGTFTWEQARSAAIARGGRLAVLNTKDQQDRLLAAMKAAKADGRFWIGGHDTLVEGDFRWLTATGAVDGPTVANPKNWAQNQPSNQNDADGMEVSSSLDFRWSMAAVSKAQGYIIEFPTTDPNVADTDGDGLTDGQEGEFRSNPTLVDTDGDGLSDKQESDFGTDPRNRDTDGDGLTDKQEFDSGSDPGNVDADNDGLTDGREKALGTDPKDPDSDDDGLPDGREVQPFVVVTGSYTLEEARVDAISRGGRLAVPASAAKQADLERQIRLNPPQGNFWLGGGDTDGPNDQPGDREGRYVWVNSVGRFFDDDGLSVGLPLSYSNWTTGQPNNTNDADGIQLLPDFKWSMSPADVQQGYILEYPVTNPARRDTDGDGLTDRQELEFLSDPTRQDTDGDGLSDLEEFDFGTDPRNPDTDGDGLSDKEEFDLGTDPGNSDADRDGLSDQREQALGTDPRDPDTDDDGLNDGEEVGLGTNPKNRDSDGDGLPDGNEVRVYSTDPTRADSDQDGLMDDKELFVHKTNPNRADTDGDGLRDSQEIRGFNGYTSNPVVVDTDGDLVSDFVEVTSVPPTDPRDATSFPSGGVPTLSNLHTVPTLVQQPRTIQVDQSFAPFGHRPDTDKTGDDGSVAIRDRNGAIIWVDNKGEALVVPNSSLARTLYVSNTECVMYNNRYDGTFDARDSTSQIVIHRRQADGTLVTAPTITIEETIVDTAPITPNTFGFTIVSAYSFDDGFEESTERFQSGTTQDGRPTYDIRRLNYWDVAVYKMYRITWDARLQTLGSYSVDVVPGAGNTGSTRVIASGSDGSFVFNRTVAQNFYRNLPEGGFFNTETASYWVSFNLNSENIQRVSDRFYPEVEDAAYVSNERLLVEFPIVEQPESPSDEGGLLLDANLNPVYISTGDFELQDFRQRATGVTNLVGTYPLDEGDRILPASVYTRSGLTPYFYTISSAGTQLKLYRSDAAPVRLGTPVQLPGQVLSDTVIVRNPLDASLLLKAEGNAGILWVPSTINTVTRDVTGLAPARSIPNSTKGLPMLVNSREAVVWLNKDAPVDLAGGGVVPRATISHFQFSSSVGVVETALTPPIEGRYVALPPSLTPDPDAEGWFVTTFEKSGDRSAIIRTYKLELSGSADRDSDGLTDYEEIRVGTDPGNPDSDADGVPDGQELRPFQLVNAQMTWEQARRDAITRGGRLAVPLNAAKQAALKASIGKLTAGNAYWIGGHDRVTEASYRWLNAAGGLRGPRVTQPSNWATYQPNNLNNADCMQAGPSSALEWSMAPNAKLQGYVIEFAVSDPTRRDTDGDGLTDGQERQFTSNPTKKDTDGDGLDDREERRFGSNPRLVDTDGDDLSDFAEVRTHRTNPTLVDTDNDGLRDGDEVARGTNPRRRDTDRDGLSDGDEVNRRTDPLKRDTDNDGLSDGREIRLGTNPRKADTDGDGLKDGDEVSKGSDPLNSRDPKRIDTDKDGLTNYEELFIYGTDPNKSDTDGDGLSDSFEVRRGLDPLKRDSDGDGVTDYDEINVTNTDPLNPSFGGGNPAGTKVPFRSKAVQGDYEGLVVGSGGSQTFKQTLRLSSNGSFSTRLFGLRGNTSFNGRFKSNGSYVGTPSNTEGLREVRMTVTKQPNGTYTVQGTYVTRKGGTYYFELRKVRSSFSKAVRKTMRVTFEASNMSGQTKGPLGSAVGTGRFRPNGEVDLTIYLPDGSTASFAGRVLNGNLIALYARSGASSNSVLVGSLRVASVARTSDFSGEVRLFSPSNVAGSFYPAGFDQQRRLLGSYYRPAPTGTLPLSGYRTTSSNSLFRWTGGDFDGVSKVGTWNTDGRIAIPSTASDRATIGFNSRTGLLTMNYTRTDASRRLVNADAKGHAVVQQADNTFRGYYVSDGAAAAFSLAPNSDDTEPEITTVSPRSKKVSAARTTYMVTVQTPGAWRVRIPSDATWVTAVVTSVNGQTGSSTNTLGNGNGKVTITVAKNSTYGRRSTVITIAGVRHELTQEFR